MTNETLFDRVVELKERFKNFWNQKKKIKALENYASVAPFHHNKRLLLVKQCMDEGFLDEDDAWYLGKMVDKYFNSENYLDWTHRTRWLKKKMRNMVSENAYQPLQQMTIFDLDKPRQSVTPNVPMEVLAAAQKQVHVGRV